MTKGRIEETAAELMADLEITDGCDICSIHLKDLQAFGMAVANEMMSPKSDSGQKTALEHRYVLVKERIEGLKREGV